MKPLLLAAALLAAPILALADEVPHFDKARMAADIRTLASDAFEGRAPATAGEEKTVAYLVGQMKAIGLAPGGDLKAGQRAWTQDVTLARFAFKGPVSVSVTAKGQAIPLVQGEQIAIRAAMTNVETVAIKDAPLVFVGYGVTAPERDWDDFKGVDLKGKIAVVLINDPDFETGAGDFGGKAMTYYGRWTYKYEEAARRGALGVLIVHETAPAAYGWATVKNSNTNVMFDIVRQDPAAKHPTLEAWIQHDVAVDLFQKAGLDFDILRTQAQDRDFQPATLKGVTFSADYAVDHAVIVSKTVAGRIVGTQRPGDMVVYSAHWDHLGVGPPDAKGDTIYNGAIDNADGIASILEIARAFRAGKAPARSVLFLALTAEERGLLGSEYYAANPLYPLARTVGVINIDALDATGPARDFSISGSAKLGLLDDLIAVGAAKGRTYSPDPNPAAGYFFRSDHFSFAKRGVPAISFDSGQDLVDGGRAAGEAWKTAYTDARYHQPADEWSDAWTLDGMIADLDLLYTLGRDLADSQRWPEWAPGSEFKAERDKTAAERK